MSDLDHRAIKGAIDRHFAGDQSLREAQLMRQHLASCDSCTRYYEHRLVLADIDPRAPPPKERIGLALGLAPRRRWGWHLGAALSVALAGLAMMILPRTPRGDGEFTARGTGAPAEPTRLFIYRAAGGGLEKVITQIAPHDALAFAYENGAQKTRLLIFGVDDSGHVYWYHPEWRDAADEPRGIPVEVSSGIHELPVAIRHNVTTTSLYIYGIFTDAPLSVRDVEQMLSASPRAGAELPIPDALQTVVPLHVEP